MFFLACVCFAFVRVCLYVPCGHLLGKGWALGFRLWCLTVSLLLSHWYPESGVVLDCIYSWSLHPYLHGLNSNISFVYGQKHKVWVLFFLVRTSGTFSYQNWADLVKFSVLQQNRIVCSNSIQGTLLNISSNWLGNKTFISSLVVVKLLPHGTVADLMHFCTRPLASCNSA